MREPGAGKRGFLDRLGWRALLNTVQSFSQSPFRKADLRRQAREPGKGGPF